MFKRRLLLPSRDYFPLVCIHAVLLIFRDGKLYATVRTATKTWTVAAPGFKTGEWQIVDVSWHPEIGIVSASLSRENRVAYHKKCALRFLFNAQ